MARVNTEAKEQADMQATVDADKLHKLEIQCAKEAARADAAETSVTKLKEQALKITQRGKPSLLRRASSLITFLTLYIINAFIYTAGTMLTTMSSVLAGGGNRMLGLRTRYLVISALATQSFSLEVPVAETHGRKQQASSARDYDIQIVAALEKKNTSQFLRPCLMALR